MASKGMKAKVTKKKDSNLLLWGLGVLILIVVIVLIVRSGKEAPAEGPETTPTEPVTAPEEPVKILNLEEVKCDTPAAIGYKPKSCSLLESGDATLTIIHQGSAALKGFQYYMKDQNGEMIGEDAQMMAVEGGAEATLTLPVSKFTGVYSVEIRPVMNVNGVDSICKNQHVLQVVGNC